MMHGQVLFLAFVLILLQNLASSLHTQIYNSMYGDIWDTSGDFGEPTSDTAYSDIYLPPHTDMNYVADTPKYQIFTSLQEAKTGGGSS